MSCLHVEGMLISQYFISYKRSYHLFYLFLQCDYHNNDDDNDDYNDDDNDDVYDYVSL